MALQLGSCGRDDIAARVLTRIIGHFPGQRNQLIIDAGFVALSQQGFDELGKTMAIIKVTIFLSYRLTQYVLAIRFSNTTCWVTPLH